MPAFEEYAERRNFSRTPEPAPRTKRGRRSNGRRFVVQAHAARSMHYDFRLELDGVLLSWAIPKGPSLDPEVKRLAMQTEDHPIEYADFEGVIPRDQYGGGSVIVWDRGEWVPEGDARQGMSRGKLRFELKGHKLKGVWNLVRTRTGTKKGGKDKQRAWLLIKSRDDEARSGEAAANIVDEAPESVISGRTLEHVQDSPDRVWQSAKSRGSSAARPVASELDGARKRPYPRDLKPELATLVKEPPTGTGWLHEPKWDGYRLLAQIRRGSVRLLTRSHQDWTDRLGTIERALLALPLGEVLLDGELVVLDNHGVSRFQLLQNSLSGSGDAPIVYYAFDLLYLDGHDLTRVPLLERKAALAQLLEACGASGDRIRHGDHVLGRGSDFLRSACELGLEGMVSKRADSFYRSGRGTDWLKCKCSRRQEVVIGGFSDPKGSRTGLGALLVGLHDDNGNLDYAGKVGTGFTDSSLAELSERLAPLEQSESPFANPPRGAAARGVHWVEPVLMAEVEFTEMTHDKKLRHPSFKGLRNDKPATDIRLEQPASMARVQTERELPIELSNPDRVLYPEQGITKRQLADYYVQVAPWALPHIEDRLLTLVRCPRGHEKHCFYQKHSKDGMPEAIRTESLPGNDESYVHVNDVAGLVSLVQIGVLEVHVWGSRVDRLERPDRLVFDLDPDPKLDWARLVEGALDVRDQLEELGLQSFVKTTGGKGLHVVVPVTRRSEWDEAKAFAKAIAERMAAKAPKKYVSTMAKDKRHGRIFVDYLRNAREATAIAPFSSRARSGAPVATPIAWEELSEDVRGRFDIDTVPKRLAGLESDPWNGFFELRQSITAKAKRMLGLE